MKRLVMSLTAAFIMTSALAGGSMTLEGTIKATSTETVTVADASKIYTLTLSKLGGDQEKKIRAAKAGATLQLQVPFEAIQAVVTK